MTSRTDQERWIAERMRHIESSGIRKVFELARSLKDPGQPQHRPAGFRRARADQGRRPRGHRPRRQRLHRHAGHPRAARQDPGRRARRAIATPTARSFITSGTSGGLVLALCCTVNPGDEVIVFDPYFVMYPHLVTLAGGKTVYVDTYPDFSHRRRPGPRRHDAAHQGDHRQQSRPIRPAASMRARCCATWRSWPASAACCCMSDEVYRVFCYDQPFVSPAEFNEDVLVFDGFSKAYGMTGWRLGFAHGPRRLIEEMIKLQQFTFVCAPSMVQHAGVAAWDYDVSGIVADYRRKRDRIYEGLKDRFELVRPEGAFYLFPQAPQGTGSEFVAEAIRNNLLIIPGNVFSKRDTHFRLSYAADERTLERGIEILNRIA